MSCLVFELGIVSISCQNCKPAKPFKHNIWSTTQRTKHFHPLAAPAAVRHHPRHLSFPHHMMPVIVGWVRGICCWIFGWLGWHLHHHHHADCHNYYRHDEHSIYASIIAQHNIQHTPHTHKLKLKHIRNRKIIDPIVHALWQAALRWVGRMGRRLSLGYGMSKAGTGHGRACDWSLIGTLCLWQLHSYPGPKRSSNPWLLSLGIFSKLAFVASTNISYRVGVPWAHKIYDSQPKSNDWRACRWRFYWFAKWWPQRQSLYKSLKIKPAVYWLRNISPRSSIKAKSSL